jgi:hypothetical protein
VLCINPPFTEAYLADVMARLPELKLRFRLRRSVNVGFPWENHEKTMDNGDLNGNIMGFG